MRLVHHFDPQADAVVFRGDCVALLAEIPPASVQLVVTSPPYNIGKSYEKRTALQEYLAWQDKIVDACCNALSAGGSICWQVGNHVDQGEIFPLDILLFESFRKRGLQLRNRIVWHFEHGLHASKRFSGRYETILWFTKARADGSYTFNLDPVRVPQKYPGKKHYKGDKKGQYSANPLGKNPGDLWVIPNVKHNHPEKTIHPCQFPIELVERLVLALTNEGDLVLDPFMGVGSTLAAAVRHRRRTAGADISTQYCEIAERRVVQAANGDLAVRPRGRPVYVAPAGSAITSTGWLSDPSLGLPL